MAAPLHGTNEGTNEPRPNPFGNYSLLEAQQPKAVGSSAAVRESPFANYSFKEAQQNDACPSPTSTGAANEGVPEAHMDADTRTVFVQAADSV
ncbi:hypothetical protein GGF48_005464, partial [Coemansia sp. RSA 921]